MSSPVIEEGLPCNADSRDAYWGFFFFTDTDTDQRSR